MAINKNKINDNALKYIQKGQIKKAIKEYEKILSEDPGDVRTLLKKGDLLVRVGDRVQAVETYLTVANAYSQQGFHLKAVAVFKQILKIDETRVDVNLRLAEEYQNLGIIGDAMAHLKIVAAYYDQNGMYRESLETLRRMVELDPDNIASRIKLAELYSREDMLEEAVAEFQRAAQELKNANRIEDFIKVAERLIYHDPTNVALVKELANIYLQRGDTKRALGKLQISFKADPRDLETLSMLAMAFQELNQLSKTVSVHKEIAKIYEEQGAVAQMNEVYQRILEIAPDDPEARQALGVQTQANHSDEYLIDMSVEPSIPEETIPSIALMEDDSGAEDEYEELEEVEEIYEMPELEPEVEVSNETPRRIKDANADQIYRLLTETDVYIKYGLHNKAYEHLDRVFAIDPNNIEAHDKLKDLYIAAEQHDHAAQELVTLIHLCSRFARHDQAQSYLAALLALDPNHPDAPALQHMLAQNMPQRDTQEFQTAGDLESPAVLEMGESLDSIDVQISFEESGELNGLDADTAAQDTVMVHPGEYGPDEGLEDSFDDESDLFDQAPVGDFDEDLSLEMDSDQADEDLPSWEDVDELLGVSQQDDEEEDAPTKIANLEELSPAQTADSAADEVILLDATNTNAAEEEPILIEALEDEDELLLLEDEPAYANPEPGPQLDDQLAAELGQEKPILGYDEPILLEGESAATGGQTTQADQLPASQFLAQDEKTEESQPSDFQVPEESTIPLDLDMEQNEFINEPPTQLAVAPAGIETLSLEPSVTDAPLASQTTLEVKADTEAEADSDTDSDLIDGMEEVEFFIQQNLLDEANDTLQMLIESFPDHPQVLELADKLRRLQQGEEPASTISAQDLGESFDLAAELEREVDQEFVGPIDDEFQYSVDDVFSEFKKGVAKVVDQGDSATHFDLGIAYKEMGLLDDAISEFATAAEGAAKPTTAKTMIGLCYSEKGQLNEAIVHFKDALAQSEVTDQEATGLYYEIGSVYERQQDFNEAAFYYKKVYQRDPKFRDIKDRVKALVKQAGNKKEGKDSVSSGSKSDNKDKISYM